MSSSSRSSSSKSSDYSTLLESCSSSSSSCITVKPCSSKSKSKRCPSISSSDWTSSLPCQPIPIHPSSDDNCKQGSYCYNNSMTTDNSTFNALVMPLTNAKATYTNHGANIQFKMKRSNNIVNLSWEPFTGNISANGTAWLTINQSINNLPSWPVTDQFNMIYLGQSAVSIATIDPSTDSNVRFYLKADKSAVGSIGDTVEMPGGSIQWVVPDN